MPANVFRLSRDGIYVDSIGREKERETAILEFNISAKFDTLAMPSELLSVICIVHVREDGDR